jgi:hypothetical protein
MTTTTTSFLVLCLVCLRPATVDAAPPLAAFTTSAVNLIPAQIASAAISYIGLVACLDRPRGPLAIGAAALEIKPSQVPGAGLGLYCAAPSLAKGTILGNYPGSVIPLEQNLCKLNAFPRCESYIWRFSDSQMVIDPTDAEGRIQDLCAGGNPSTAVSQWICENILAPFLSKPTTLCRINEPPIGRDVNVVTDEDLKRRTVTFRLERDVYQGEEFFMDYGITYDRSSYGP